ncbi:MAG: hypothetical protein KJ896_05715, partial [Nanoarchaeota archaeon]|nr:hypothetical protein [Nanoarchaeota archaeon]
MFGISKEQLQEKLHELSTNLRDYVDRYAIKEFDRKLENLTGRVEATGEVAKGNGSRIDELTSLVERYERRLSSQDERIRELEKSQERSGIVSNVVKGEGQWNFEGVKELATGVSDLAYEKIRDHLLLEMAKKGYEDRHLSQFAIYDQESGATLRFYNSDYNGFEETGNLSGISTWGTKKPESVENKDRGKLLVIE